MRLAVALAAGLAFVAAPVAADGGRVRLRQDVGTLTLTVFTSPQPLAAGTSDVSVLVQDRASGRVLLDGDVTLRVLGPGESAPRTLAAGAGTNRLLRSASVSLPAPGDWAFEVIVRRAGETASARCVLPVGPAPSPLSGLWTYLAAPPVAIVLFALGASVRRRRELAFSK